jgi:hypothetical protein
MTSRDGDIGEGATLDTGNAPPVGPSPARGTRPAFDLCGYPRPVLHVYVSPSKLADAHRSEARQARAPRLICIS